MTSEETSNVILREETFVELGSAEAGSLAFVLWTANPDMINNGRITLIGPDITESSGKSLPFAQILMVGGKHIGNEDSEGIQDVQFIDGRIDGFMVRSLFKNMWCRVSRSAAEKGFCFEMLGRILMAGAKVKNEKIESMEIIFITSGRDDLAPLADIDAQAHKISREAMKDKWKIKGYDIDCGLDCGACVDKNACDDIRKALQEMMAKEEE